MARSVAWAEEAHARLVKARRPRDPIAEAERAKEAQRRSDNIVIKRRLPRVA